MSADPTGPREALAQERRLRRRAEARSERLEHALEQARGAVETLERSVRYRLGDALVRAARPSLDTLRLPGRILAILRDGWRQRRERRSAQQREQQVLRGHGADAPVDTPALREPPALPFAPHPLVSTAFAPTPPGLVRCPTLRVALLCDEFSWDAWRFEAGVFTFTPQDWRAVLDAQRPDLLLVESTWGGPGGTWRHEMCDFDTRSDTRYVLPEVIAWCRAHRVPTVFYNKEDPPNFEHFVAAAGLFDFVFTSDADCIPDYEQRLGHGRVFALPFAAQPRLHNPLAVGPRDGQVCFAGTWYQRRHLQRQDAAGVILAPALEFGLHIYDRMAGRGGSNYAWPAEFQRALRGGLPYGQMLTAYKRYKAFLNVNSVTTSPTMFARRVFELLACGTPVISAYSEGIAELLGEDLVLMSRDADETRAHLERVFGDAEYRDRLALRGQRAVFSGHTYADRLNTVLQQIGLPTRPAAEPQITLLAAVQTAAETARTRALFARQDYQAKSLVLCARDPRAVAAVEVDAATGVLVREERAWGALLAEACATAHPAGWFAALDPGRDYGPAYLRDAAHATRFAPAAALAKAQYTESVGASTAAPGPEYVVLTGDALRHCVPGSAVVAASEIARLAPAFADAATANEWWGRLLAGCGSVYVGSRFEFPTPA